jgi:hypothetical protein
MICRNCGTDIADKALICYRCGTPTSVTESPAARPPARRGVRLVLPALALLVLGFAALFLGRAGEIHVPPALSYAVAGLAALILVVRFVRRRR